MGRRRRADKPEMPLVMVTTLTTSSGFLAAVSPISSPSPLSSSSSSSLLLDDSVLDTNDRGRTQQGRGEPTDGGRRALSVRTMMTDSMTGSTTSTKSAPTIEALASGGKASSISANSRDECGDGNSDGLLAYPSACRENGNCTFVFFFSNTRHRGAFL